MWRRRMMSPLHETSSGSQEFSCEERTLLLRLAHLSIKSALDRTEIFLPSLSPHLAEPRGAFTTLYHHGKLRGCVGFVEPVAPLYQTVIETARAAAFEDTRFWPVAHEELPGLQVSLSVLTKPEPILPEQVEIGLHGLIVSMGGRRGLLLPQVPAEHNWDRSTFLEQTCKKAGLPLNAWQQGASIEGFTAEVFGEQ